MPVFKLAWTLYIQVRRCCLQNCPGNGVPASATAVREEQALTVGAASSNIIPQVEALFSSLSEMRPAKIPPEKTHRGARKTFSACFAQKTSVSFNETQPNYSTVTCNSHGNILINPTSFDLKITKADSCSSSLFIPTKYPRQKAFSQVPHGPTAGVLESSHWSLKSSHATEDLVPCPCHTATRGNKLF